MTKIHSVPKGTLQPDRAPVVVPEPVAPPQVIYSLGTGRSLTPKVRRSTHWSNPERVIEALAPVVHTPIKGKLAKAPTSLGMGRPAQNAAAQP